MCSDVLLWVWWAGQYGAALYSSFVTLYGFTVFLLLEKTSDILAINDSKKGDAVPLQAWSGPKGSRKLRFRDFMPAALDGGKFVSCMHRPPLPPGNTPGTHLC
jgi:hypothetical protein